VIDTAQARRIAGIVLTGMGLAAAISVATAQTTFHPPPFKQFLEENGWVSLPAPDKRMGPGSVIKVTKKDGSVNLQWLGDLRRCGITDAEFRFVRGKYPGIGVGESFGVQVSVPASFIAKLRGTVDFEKAGGAIMQIEASGGDAVDFNAWTTWIAKSAGAPRMPQLCYRFFTEDDIYLVSEAFRISRASFGLVDKNGAKLPVTGGAFASSASGTLSVIDDLYFGVRGVKQLTLDSSEPGLESRSVGDADSLLRLMEP